MMYDYMYKFCEDMTIEDILWNGGFDGMEEDLKESMQYTFDELAEAIRVFTDAIIEAITPIMIVAVELCNKLFSAISRYTKLKILNRRNLKRQQHYASISVRRKRQKMILKQRR